MRSGAPFSWQFHDSLSPLSNDLPAFTAIILKTLASAAFRVSSNKKFMHTQGCLSHGSLSIKQMRLGVGIVGKWFTGRGGRNLGTSSKETLYYQKLEVISSSLKNILLLCHFYLSRVHFHNSSVQDSITSILVVGECLKYMSRRYFSRLFSCNAENTHTHQVTWP